MSETTLRPGSGQARNLPRDVFLHLLAIVTLYWSAISVITLCWQYVNYFFPDVLNYNYGFAGNVRFAVSSLIIVFPVFIATSWFLNKIYAKESAVRESKIRKWLIYLTLFIAALVIIGDLIFVINNLLGGETTPRFLLKALSIIIVAGVVFGYYLDDVRRSVPAKLAKYVAWVCGAVVLIGIVGAFFIVGSPFTARQQQFDQQKISDLQNIQSQVAYYWQRKGQLPESLSSLNDAFSGYITPFDSQTNTPYEYKITAPTELVFELCADFNLPNDFKPTSSYTLPSQFNDRLWSHGKGRTCFSRSIDQQLYPPIKK